MNTFKSLFSRFSWPILIVSAFASVICFFNLNSWSADRMGTNGYYWAGGFGFAVIAVLALIECNNKWGVRKFDNKK